MFCQEWSLVKSLNAEITVLPLRCKCWHCPECRPRRKAKLIHEAEAGQPTLFITLTSRYREGGDPHAAARDLVKAWRKVRAEHMKVHGKRSLSFLAVFEATANGWPHIHIVARCAWLDQRWLSKRMSALIGAPIVDVRRVDGIKKVAKYVGKYIGKNPEVFEGVKRYWRSLDYLTPEDKEEELDPCNQPTWTIVRQDWVEYIRGTDAPHLLSRESFRVFCAMHGIPP